jgi:N-acetylglucosaminyldiphosphoundecaprenol N-acetyl-beta-D-mannosaminyltransferase
MPESIAQASVLGLPIHVLTTQDVLRFVAQRIDDRRPARIVTLNAEYAVLAHRDPRFAEVISSADLVTPDGAGIVWAMRRRGVRGARRVGGSDLIWTLSEQAALRGDAVFFLGGAPGVAADAAQALKATYPRLKIAGYHPGSPSPEEEARIVDLIRRSNADLLFVAFGAPQQDIWIANALHRTGVAAAMGVGGSFDYLAGTARRAPRWMREHSLEWFWRLLNQPWRWRRMLALPQFVWLVWRESRAR